VNANNGAATEQIGFAARCLWPHMMSSPNFRKPGNGRCDAVHTADNSSHTRAGKEPIIAGQRNVNREWVDTLINDLICSSKAYHGRDGGSSHIKICTLSPHGHCIWRFRQFITTTIRRLFANMQATRSSANADRQIHFKIEFAEIQYQHGIA
jgi:hypothetical protein